MSKFHVDYNQLNESVNRTSYKLSEVKDKIEKVAFDIVRFKDSDSAANLWKVESSGDGDYIVTLYSPAEDEVVKTASVKNDWEVLYSKSSSSLNIFYKGDQIAKLASGDLGLSGPALEQAESFLPKSLSENKKMVVALLNQLPEITKNAVLNKYPELK